jgi:hypothetical protein
VCAKIEGQPTGWLFEAHKPPYANASSLSTACTPSVLFAS